ncbi:MAG: hypothetical protein WCO97_09125, partial [bacterium]
MATIAQNILIDLNSLRIVRENNHLVGQRSFNFTEGNDYTGQINLIKNGIAYAGTISSLVIEIGNSQNDVALVRYEGTTKDFNLSFVGDLLRQYLYNSASKESVFSIGLTVDGLPVIIDDVATVLIANPSDNTGGTSWDSVTGKPSTFTPSAHTHAKSEVGLGNVDNTADADKTVSHASTADNSDTVTSLEGHKVSELSNDSGFLNDVSGATVA